MALTIKSGQPTKAMFPVSICDSYPEHLRVNVALDGSKARTGHADMLTDSRSPKLKTKNFNLAKAYTVRRHDKRLEKRHELIINYKPPIETPNKRKFSSPPSFWLESSSCNNPWGTRVLSCQEIHSSDFHFNSVHEVYRGIKNPSLKKFVETTTSFVQELRDTDGGSMRARLTELDKRWRCLEDIRAERKMPIPIKRYHTLTDYVQFAHKNANFDGPLDQNKRSRLIYDASTIAGNLLFKDFNLDKDENTLLNELWKKWIKLDYSSQTSSSKNSKNDINGFLRKIDFMNKSALLRISRLNELFIEPPFMNQQSLKEVLNSAFKFLADFWKKLDFSNFMKQTKPAATSIHKVFATKFCFPITMNAAAGEVFILWQNEKYQELRLLLNYEKPPAKLLKQALSDKIIQEALYYANFENEIELYAGDFKITPQTK
ncbi:hypothetical protein O181_058810 [Austropuccinia psidii MF-1]|uniref:Uncharacterized protein n=1 Tax=Austropuccinia psidii MF-1 TaxID=1389203 RepID=A0A9Q3EHA1_9BASI|nr:hypothetical protein [Austropuccinia psidii MF-1]